MTRADDDEPDPSETVIVVGRCRQRYDLTMLQALPRIEPRCTVTCASGERTTADWAGAPVADLLSESDPPPETTHLQVTSDDGYRACLPVQVALDGILPYERNDQTLTACGSCSTRFDVPDVDGARLVKGVTRLGTLTLDPATDRANFEPLSLEQPA